MATRDPVIIVGAGPAGLTVAVSLALQDVPVIVLESNSKLTRDLRAGSFHPPTLEMFGPLGVAEDFLNRKSAFRAGRCGTGAMWWSNGTSVSCRT